MPIPDLLPAGAPVPRRPLASVPLTPEDAERAIAPASVAAKPPTASELFARVPKAPHAVGGVWSPEALKEALDAEFPSTVKAVHAQTGQVLDLAPDVAEKAYKEGTITVGAGDTYHVRLGDGTVQEVRGKQLSDLLNADPANHLASQRDLRDQQLLHPAKSDTAQTIAEGVGRGFSGGLTDTGQTAEQTEETRARKENHGLLSGLSEAGGVLLGAGLTGGGSLVDEAGAGLAARLGASEGGGLLARAAAKAIPQALRAGTEGAAIGHAEAVSEEALGGGPITAEKYLASVGGNALWGAALGAGGGVTSELLGTRGQGGGQGQRGPAA